MTLTDVFTIFVIILSIGFVILAFAVYIKEALAVEFLSGVEGVSNVTWGNEYPDNYYNDSYPIVKDEQEHADESKSWQENGWAKLK